MPLLYENKPVNQLKSCRPARNKNNSTVYRLRAFIYINLFTFSPYRGIADDKQQHKLIHHHHHSLNIDHSKRHFQWRSFNMRAPFLKRKATL